MARNKIGGGLGTNQYQVRGRKTPRRMPADAPHMRLAQQLNNSTAAKRRDTAAQLRKQKDGGITEATFEHLAADSDHGVRKAVAGNSDTPVRLLERLAGDSHSAVRAAVANNPRTPEALIALLASDVSYGVRNAAKWNPRMHRVRWPRLRRRGHLGNRTPGLPTDGQLGGTTYWWG